jgi:hypothetical protein
MFFCFLFSSAYHLLFVTQREFHLAIVDAAVELSL